MINFGNRNLNSAVALVNEKKYAEAISIFEDAFSTMQIRNFQFENESMAIWYRVLGDCYIMIRDKTREIESYRKSLSYKWYPIPAHNLFGALFEEKRYDDALRLLKDGLEKGGFPSFTYRIIGQLFETLGEYQKAFDSFDFYISKCNEESPDKPLYESDTLRSKGNCLEKLGKIDQAKFCYDEANRMDKNNINDTKR
jgi:tetratricopeptide (TPR) repeat protein